MRVRSTRALLPLAVVGGVVAVVTACSGSGSTGTAAGPSRPTTGVVAGRVLFVGGPAPGRPRPLTEGSVTLEGAQAATTPLDGEGSFVVHVPPGTYRVTATSPEYDDGRGVCRAPRPVPVLQGERVSIRVFCQIR
jgi:hypothetical protein